MTQQATGEDVSREVRRFVDSLPPTVVRLLPESISDEEPLDSIRLVPTNPRAAAITVYFDDAVSVLDLEIGSDTLLELAAFRDDWRSDSMLHDLTRVLHAVSEGRVTETLWAQDGKVLRSTAHIVVDHHIVELVHQHAVEGARTGGEPTRIDYEAYAA